MRHGRRSVSVIELITGPERWDDRDPTGLQQRYAGDEQGHKTSSWPHLGRSSVGGERGVLDHSPSPASGSSASRRATARAIWTYLRSSTPIRRKSTTEVSMKVTTSTYSTRSAPRP